MTKTIIILAPDVTTIMILMTSPPASGFALQATTQQAARDAEDAELDKIFFSVSSSATKGLNHKGYT